MICGAVGKGIGKYCMTNKDAGQFVYRTSITIKGVTTMVSEHFAFP